MQGFPTRSHTNRAVQSQKMAISDNAFLAGFFDCWKAGQLFSIQHLDLSCRNRTYKNVENRSKNNVTFLWPK